MQEEQLEVKAFYANENGEGYVEGSISGNINEASSLGKQLAEKLMTARAQKVSSSDPIIE
jgi:porphobilinogen deaminase